MEETKKSFNCTMELTLSLIGGKWKPIIIYYIGTQGSVRYGELRRLIPGISQRVLSRELRELEAARIVARKSFEGKVLHVEYSLTAAGKDVLPILNALTVWGNTYNEKYNYATVTLG